MTKIKICGLKTLADVEQINQQKPDYAGFVFYDKSSRHVTEEQAQMMRSRIDPRIITVGVFVNADMNLIYRLVSKNVIQVVQLHGTETEEDVLRLRQMLPDQVQIMKAFRIDSQADVEEAMRTNADYPLLDHGAGGTGTNFDWNLINNLEREFFLAGGLSCENVLKAIQLTSPYAVDVSSGVETNHRKDPLKIKQFIDNVRMAE